MPETILVVDDEPSVGLLLSKILEKDGYLVRVCLTPAAALDLLARERVDLLVVDKNLPGMTGFEVVNQARVKSPHLPAIMITAFPEPILAPTSRLQGYLPKPLINLQQVSETVRRVLEFAQWRARMRAETEKGEALSERADPNAPASKLSQ